MDRYMKKNLGKDRSMLQRPLSPQSKNQRKMDKVVSNVIMSILHKLKNEYEEGAAQASPMEEKRLAFPELEDLRLHTMAEVGDLEMFEMALVKAKDMQEDVINQYVTYLTGGQLRSEIMFRFWQSLRTKFTKDLINSFSMKNNQMIDTLTKDILERVSVINREGLLQSP